MGVLKHFYRESVQKSCSSLNKKGRYCLAIPSKIRHWFTCSRYQSLATVRKLLAPFSVSHVIAIDSYSPLSRTFSLSFLFLDFIAISDFVFNNKNNYSTQVCWISNNYNHFGAMRLVGYISYLARPRCIRKFACTHARL